ncbi:conserved membrane hypothetical protein [Mesorhizobium plurifarium]|uniref:Uncharacterized protein n=1 Tax=Mesorhizobium plurifarium TaxID=69974 RepID=A0A090F1N7_MESPL|nr:conserved membrane hypothetical protein [Mesorhizobium plurifarium]
MRSTSDTVAAIGLAIGGALGMAGTFVGSDALRETLWTIDGAGVVVATALLTMKCQRLGNDPVAAGFLTFLAGESLLLAGNAAGLQASVPSYAGGIALWAAGLVMVSAQANFAPWMRLTAFVAAALFTVSVLMILWGAREQFQQKCAAVLRPELRTNKKTLLPTSAPLPALGYPFLVLTFIGWIWTLLKAER